MDYRDFTVIIPTINEEKTIGILASRILSDYNGISIVVVDDGSTDKTKRIVERMASKDGKVIFYDRKQRALPRGLAHSMMTGLDAAKTRYVIFIDGDLQHPPSVIKKIATSLKNGAKIAIAVRKKTHNQILYRRIITRVFMVAGYIILCFKDNPRSSDIFSGYFGLERAYAKRIINKNRERFVGEGYKFLFDLLKCIRNNEVKIAEVPYTFKGRRYGSSKAELKQGVALIKSFVT